MMIDQKEGSGKWKEELPWGYGEFGFENDHSVVLTQEKKPQFEAENNKRIKKYIRAYKQANFEVAVRDLRYTLLTLVKFP